MRRVCHAGGVDKGLDAGVLGRAALAIVDADGLRALTMRRLARELGVDPMAAYRHVKDKEALLDALMDQLLAGVELEGLQGSAEQRLREGTRAVYDTLAAHPHAAPVLSARQWTTPAGTAIIEWGMALLVESGRSPAEALRQMNATGLFLVGLASAAGHEGPAPAFDPALHPVTVAALAQGAGLGSYTELLDVWLDRVLG